jgi:Carboxypeptidase regulatory-like domain
MWTVHGLVVFVATGFDPFPNCNISVSEEKSIMNRSVSGLEIFALANKTKARRLFPVVIQIFALLLFVGSMFAQETTGGLQGSVKDPSGALVSGAHVVITGTSLTGEKTADTDKSGYYRFANLPPGPYTITITAKGFRTSKREGLIIEVGHLPSVDFALEVGGSETIVEVSGAAPAIDVTTETTQTNVTADVIQDVPHGRSFQSVIQFAPSARNEPLEGNNTGSNGTGGMAPGSTTNGSDHGFSVAGGSDAENSYLVEGQETANLIGGYSHTNVPFDFIQEVQIKSSGVEAEHGGALGGVVNVIMKKGSNNYHGSLFMQFENNGMDGGPQAYSRYDPDSGLTAPGGTFANGTVNNTNGYVDATTQHYQPLRPKSSDVFPGFTFGGPILKDRIFGFIGFSPEWNDVERTVDYPAGTLLPNVPAGGGLIPFSRNQQTYYTTARVDASVTNKIRVFGSWLYQYQRETGVNLPFSDSTTSFVNISASTDPSVYPHGVGYTAPNSTTNFGADFTLTPHLVATTRFGYYFENYHDFGYPETGTLFGWQSSGIPGDVGATTACEPVPTPPATCPDLPTLLQQTSGHFNDANSGTFTHQNRNKAIQYDADLAWFKSGWKGTHNFKFGYQLNRLRNDILQSYNEPYVQLFPGTSGFYTPLSSLGVTNCASTAYPEYDNTTTPPTLLDCAGLYGTATVFDFGTTGNVTSFNHGLFAQDAWTIGHGITINAGVRFDKEYLPASTEAALTTNPINFGWGDKVAPRIGAAWDVFKDGRMKVFGSYGKFFDIMKLNVAISSFGGQYWNLCTYALDSSDLSLIKPALDSANRYCVGGTGAEANWAAGSTPAGLTFIENVNNRTFPTSCSTCSLTSTGVTPGLKPYSQHDSVFGVDYQISKSLSFEARWDRRRLDNAIEDSSIFSTVGPTAGSETFVIGNPGKGIEKNFTSFYNFLYPTTPPPPCAGATCPPEGMIPAARSYDGVEFRLNKSQGDHWFGMFSYTYSKLRGNYTGLTSSDISDGQQGGRSSPNNSRAFDEPYFQWNSFGGSSNGLLPTDRPNTFKGYAYYEMPWSKFAHKATTDLGIFQYVYQGSPVTSYLDVGAGDGGWAVQAWDRGKFVSASQDPTTGFITLGNPQTFRTPWYTQTDFNFTQNYKVSESKVFSFTATFGNLLNQRAITAYNMDMTSLAVTNQYISLVGGDGTDCAFATQCRIVDGDTFYAAAERPYNVQDQMNNFKARGVSSGLNTAYKTPAYFQLSRTIRLGVKFSF